MIPCFGTLGCDVPAETRMLLLEARKETNIQDTENTFYVLILPVLDGQFRTTLQGTPDNELKFCTESGQLPPYLSIFLSLMGCYTQF